ncbi:hypothetical protein [Ferrimonas aestuarii]|uniref:Uncharacterized protein n=1 Tax=Ferrimonas aestuarii TaxID=2569539 RepID=A0A4U1BNI0_9GAMM|nr:hypothetical protein [Ferrimonas aestuarii]TKB54710.1 hypothetical protein FCL42_11195 [Ferrimonas aestuarii]
MTFRSIAAVSALLLCSHGAQALTKTITIERNNINLPITKVEKSDHRITWSMFGNRGVDSVGLYWLNQTQAQQLLDNAHKARDLYQQIIDGGHCPDAEIKSRRFGEIKANDNRIDFQVICSNNNILVHYVMTDEYVVNLVNDAVEWQELERLANSVLTHYQ